jgi:hypothetical protein
LLAIGLSLDELARHNMRTTFAIGLALLIGAPVEVQAENGQVAAGILGGLAAGAIIGSAVRPAPPQPAPACYYTQGAPVWDAYRGAWITPRVRVCD